MEKKLWKHKTKDRQVWAYYVENAIQLDGLPSELRLQIRCAGEKCCVNIKENKDCFYPLFAYELDGQFMLANFSWFENRYEQVITFPHKVKKWTEIATKEVVEAVLVENELQLAQGNESKLFSIEQYRDGGSVNSSIDTSYCAFPFYVVSSKKGISLEARFFFEANYKLMYGIERPIETKELEDIQDKLHEEHVNRIKSIATEGSMEMKHWDRAHGYFVENKEQLQKISMNWRQHFVEKKDGTGVRLDSESLYTLYPLYIYTEDTKGLLISPQAEFERTHEVKPIEKLPAPSSVHTYQKVHTQVEAIQFKGFKNGNFEQCKVFCPLVERFGTFQDSILLKIADEQNEICEHGDYIVKNHKGYCVKTVEEFEKEYRLVQYRPVEEPNGQGRVGLFVHNGTNWEEIEQLELPSHLRTMDARNYTKGTMYTFGIDPIDMEEAKKNASKLDNSQFHWKGKPVKLDPELVKIAEKFRDMTIHDIGKVAPEDKADFMDFFGLREETPPYQTGGLAGFGSMKKVDDVEYREQADELAKYYEKVPVFELKEPAYKLYRHKENGSVVHGIFHNALNTEEVKTFCGEGYCEKNKVFLTEWIYYKWNREDIADTTIGALPFQSFIERYELCPPFPPYPFRFFLHHVEEQEPDEEPILYPIVIQQFDSFYMVQEEAEWFRCGYKKDEKWYISGEGANQGDAIQDFIDRAAAYIDKLEHQLDAQKENADMRVETDEPTSMTERLTEDENPYWAAPISEAAKDRAKKSDFQGWLDENFPNDSNMTLEQRMFLYDRYLSFTHLNKNR